MGRGKRYDEKPKLNIKKVVGVVALLVAVVAIVLFIINLSKPKAKTDEKVVANSYIPVLTNEKWGVINSKAETIIEPTYDEMITIPNSLKAVFICTYDVDFTNGTYKTKVLNDKNQEIFIDYELVELLQNSDSNGNIIYEDSALRIKKEGKYGLIDLDGKELVRTEYDSIVPLKGVKKSYVITKNGKKGIIDNTGSLIIDAQYKNITALTDKYEDGYIVEDSSGKKGIIDYNKQKVLECKYDEISNVYGSQLYVVKTGKNIELIDNTGASLLKNKFDSAKSIDNGNVIFKKGNSYGIIAKDGTEKVTANYQDITFMYEDIYIAKKANKYGIINLSGETKVEFIYDYITYNKIEDFIEAQKEDNTSDFIDNTFTVKITGILSNIDSENGFIRVRIDNQYKYFNFKSEEKSNTEALPTNTIFLSKKDDKYGFKDKNGVVVVDYIYDDATEQNKYGYASVKKDGKWGCINEKGKVIVDTKLEMTNNLVIDFIGKWHLAPDLNSSYYTDIEE